MLTRSHESCTTPPKIVAKMLGVSADAPSPIASSASNVPVQCMSENRKARDDQSESSAQKMDTKETLQNDKIRFGNGLRKKTLCGNMVCGAADDSRYDGANLSSAHASIVGFLNILGHVLTSFDCQICDFSNNVFVQFIVRISCGGFPVALGDVAGSSSNRRLRIKGLLQSLEHDPSVFLHVATHDQESWSGPHPCMSYT